MTNITITPANYKSMVSKNDAHLGYLTNYIEINGSDVIINGFVYVDHEVVGDGAMFLFVPVAKWVTQDYDEATDLIEVLVEFEGQEVLVNRSYSPDGLSIDKEVTEIISNDNDAFDIDEALKVAEFKALEYILTK